eukprot:RCo003984
MESPASAAAVEPPPLVDEDPFMIPPSLYHKYLALFERHREQPLWISTGSAAAALQQHLGVPWEQLNLVLALAAGKSPSGSSTEPDTLGRHQFLVACHLAEVRRRGLACGGGAEDAGGELPSVVPPALADPAGYAPKASLAELHPEGFGFACEHVGRGWRYAHAITDVCLRYAATERQTGEKLVRLFQSAEANLELQESWIPGLSPRKPEYLQTRGSLWEQWMAIKHYLEAMAQLRIRCATVIQDALRPLSDHAAATVQKISAMCEEGCGLI